MKIEENDSAGVVRAFIAVYLPLAVCVVLVSLLINAKQEAAQRKDFEYLMKAAVALKRTTIETDIAARITDAVLLADITSLYCGNAGAPGGGLRNIYLAFAGRKKVYGQVRFINHRGYETIRVNMEKDGPMIIDEERLQDKSDRYYFEQTMAVAKGRVFASRFDLNIENGRIEFPYKPMLRLGSPVETAGGGKPGVVILNYRGAGLIDRINEPAGVESVQFYFTDDNGYWFIGPAREDEWGFMFEYKLNKAMKHTFPDAWKQIAEKEAGTVFTRNGMFVFTNVYPIGCDKARETCVGEKETYTWKIVGHLPPEALLPEWRLLATGLAVSALAALAILTWIWASARQKRICFEKRLFEQAITDELTKIPNRRRFMEVAKAELQRKQRYGHGPALMMIDLDHFKSVNDNYGHQIGDRVLETFANLGKKSFRDADIFARLGGEEFAVLMPETDLDAAVSAAERFRQKTAELTIESGSEQINVTISIGVADADDTMRDLESLLKKADSALYFAKEKGRNRVEAAGPPETEKERTEAP